MVHRRQHVCFIMCKCACTHTGMYAGACTRSHGHACAHHSLSSRVWHAVVREKCSIRTHLAVHVLVARVIGVDGHSRVTQHCLNAGGGHHNLTRTVLQRVPVVQAVQVVHVRDAGSTRSQRRASSTGFIGAFAFRYQDRYQVAHSLLAHTVEYMQGRTCPRACMRTCKQAGCAWQWAVQDWHSRKGCEHAKLHRLIVAWHAHEGALGHINVIDLTTVQRWHMCTG